MMATIAGGGGGLSRAVVTATATGVTATQPYVLSSAVAPKRPPLTAANGVHQLTVLSTMATSASAATTITIATTTTAINTTFRSTAATVSTYASTPTTTAATNNARRTITKSASADGGTRCTPTPPPTKTNGRSRHPVPVVSVNGHLFEGSHIHYSPVDNKPLCSYSTKLCKQRRINGYAFCIRHILEDPTAPFRQCRHVAKYNQQKCSNAIPAGEKREFCNSHMQIAGMAPKKERKDKKANNCNNNNAINGSNSNSISDILCAVNGDEKAVTDVNKILSEKLAAGLAADELNAGFTAFIRPTLKVNGVKNGIHTIGGDSKPSFDKCMASAATIGSGLTATALLNETSISSHKNNQKLTNNTIAKGLNNTKTTDSKINTNKRPKRKKKADTKKSIDKFVFARRKRFGDNLFNYHIWSESDDDVTDDVADDAVNRMSNCAITGAGVGDDMSADVFPHIFGTFATSIEDMEPNELKTELIAEKVLLKNLISVRTRDFAPQLDKTRAILKSLNTASTGAAIASGSSSANRYSYMDYKLLERGRRSEQCIRKGICCYASDEDRIRCRRPALPFTRHCSHHILYNVDQLLYARCTAKCAQTMTVCSRPTFDIINEDPLCDYHQMLESSAAAQTDERPNTPTNESKSGKKRRKPKPMALTRVTRRSKKRKKGANGPDGDLSSAVIIEDSIDGRLSIGSVDDDSLHSHSDTNDITINLLAQKEPIIQANAGPNVKHIVMSSAVAATVPQPTATTAVASVVTLTSGHQPVVTTAPPVIVSELQFSRLPPLLPPVTTNSMASVLAHGSTSIRVPLSPVVVMDHSMPPPPPLEPTEEALVASIVADLPQLTSDADFTDVLNKIPDEAFSEFLLDHQNGDIPSTEETEALEQALAIVNKDVQNLVAFAGMNGTHPTSGGHSAHNMNGVSGGGGVQLGEFGGQSDIIGFTNWLGSLTSEQRQQLNGLIDGAIASNSLSPILKNACEAYPQTLQPQQPLSAPAIMKASSLPPLSQHSPYMNNTGHIHSANNAFQVVYPINPLTLGPTPHQQQQHQHQHQQQHQDFITHSTPVPIMNTNLLMNGLSSHPS